MPKTTSASRENRAERLLIGLARELRIFRKSTEKFQKEMLDFKQSTHRSFRQLSGTVDKVVGGLASLDAGLTVANYNIAEIRAELDTVHETVNDTYNKMDKFVGKTEQNEQEISSMNAAVERLEKDKPELPPDES